MCGNGGHRLFVFDCGSPKSAGQRQRNLVVGGSSRTKANWAISSRPTNASIPRQIWVRTNQFVQRPCSRASPRMYIMWAAFLLSKLLHALYTIFTPSYRQVLLIRAATTSKI